MKLQFNFVAHPGHLVRSNFNLCVLGCVPAMVAGHATTAPHVRVRAFCGSFGGNDAAMKGAARGTLHDKWEKNGTALRTQSATRA